MLPVCLFTLEKSRRFPGDQASVEHLDSATNVVRPATETDREPVPARSAAQCFSMAALIWTSLSLSVLPEDRLEAVPTQ